MTSKPNHRQLSDKDLSTLGNICLTAADRYKEHAKTLRELAAQPAPPEGAMFPHGLQAARLADQFDRQEREARDFFSLFSEALPFNVEIEEEEMAG